MPALYFGLLALAGALDECWNGIARRWEHLALLAPIVPCLVLGLGFGWGASGACSIAAGYLLVLRRREEWDGKFVCLIFVSSAVLIFLYFLPLWTGAPLSETGYASRMWLSGQGLASWL